MPGWTACGRRAGGRDVVVAFTPQEIEYLRLQPLARLATTSNSGQPDVVPLAFEFDGECF